MPWQGIIRHAKCVAPNESECFFKPLVAFGGIKSTMVMLVFGMDGKLVPKKREWSHHLTGLAKMYYASEAMITPRR